MVLLLMTTLALGRDVLETETPSASWHSVRAWTKGRRPDKRDRVLIPGNGTDAEIQIKSGRDAFATSVLVGKPENAYGELSVFGELRVTGSNTRGERNAGQLIIGGADNVGGLVIHKAGSRGYYGTAIRIGGFENSQGRMFIRGSDVRTPGTVYIANHKMGTGTLEVLGNKSTIIAKRVIMGPGHGSLVFTRNSDGLSPIQVSDVARLSGTLRATVRGRAPKVIPLITTRGTGAITGGFRSVQIDGPTDRPYELTYVAGREQNEVALLRVDQPLTTFARWQEVMLERAATDEAKQPRADADGDNLTNLGEYKLGRHPLQNEGRPFRFGVENGLKFIEFTERKDRKDVQSTVQISTDTRVWTSNGVTTEVVERFGNTRTIRASADSVKKLRFRIVFQRTPQRSVRPNILFITIDDLNDFVEPLGGHPQAVTPNINSLAARGTLFTNAHAASTLCHPSRTALLTGIHPSTSGVYTNDAPFRNSPALADVNTIPQHFNSKGYTVVGAGKIFHREQPGAWSEYFPSRNMHRPVEPTPGRRLSGVPGLRDNFDFGPLQVNDASMGDHKVASWIRRWITERTTEDGPAFIGCGFFRPHLPFHVPQKHFDEFDRSEVDIPLVLPEDLEDIPRGAFTASMLAREHAQIRAAGRWKKAVVAYLAAIRFVDAQVGRVIAALDNSEVGRNTIIVLCSDHGFHLGEKMAWRKNSLWEENTRVPLIVVAPGVTTPGARCDEPVSLIDVFPTLLDLTELPIPSRLDGTSLLPQLIDPEFERDFPVITSRSRNAHSVRSKQFRLTNRSGRNDEMYDHSIDPNEWTNLIDDPTYASARQDLREYVPTDAAASVSE